MYSTAAKPAPPAMSARREVTAERYPGHADALPIGVGLRFQPVDGFRSPVFAAWIDRKAVQAQRLARSRPIDAQGVERGHRAICQRHFHALAVDLSRPGRFVEHRPRPGVSVNPTRRVVALHPFSDEQI